MADHQVRGAFPQKLRNRTDVVGAVGGLASGKLEGSCRHAQVEFASSEPIPAAEVLIR